MRAAASRRSSARERGSVPLLEGIGLAPPLAAEEKAVAVDKARLMRMGRRRGRRPVATSRHEGSSRALITSYKKANNFVEKNQDDELTSSPSWQ